MPHRGSDRVRHLAMRGRQVDRFYPAHSDAYCCRSHPAKEARMPGRVEHINPDGLAVNPAFTHVVTVTGPVKTVYIGAQNAVDGNRNIVGKGDIGAQTEQILRNIDVCLAAAGANKENLISWNIYVAEGNDIRPAFEAGMRWWGSS